MSGMGSCTYDGKDAVLGRNLARTAPSEGKSPRFVALDPDGAFLFACNQNSDTIVTFRVDAATGALEPPGPVAAVPSPVCMVFAPGE